MSATAILRGAAAAFLLSLAAIPAASANHRAGHGGPFYGAPAVKTHARVHHGGVMRPALHHRHHGIRHGHHHGIRHGGHHGVGRHHHGLRHHHHGLRHHGFHTRHHARPAFFPHGRHGFHRGRLHGAAYGHFPRKRFFRVHGHGYGHGYGALRYAAPAYYPYEYGVSHGYGPALAYGTVAGAAPYGPLYNRPACVCY